MLTEKVSSFITEKNLISPKDKIIVAVSGGRDSVCLLHILNSLKQTSLFKLSVIHINHGTRGLESDKDQQFVIALCEKLQIDCTHFKLTGFSSNAGENALRKARYAIFEERIAQLKNSKIATAHHLNDQLETYLMRLFKGSGVRGLLGIPHFREGYIRPLLQCTREEINAYCKKHKIEYREDLSNSETGRLRNNIRQNIVPVIQNVFGIKFLEEFQKSHQEFIELFFENSEYNKGLFKKISKKDNGSIKVSINHFETLSFLKKRQFLEYCISYVCGLNLALGKEQITEFGLFINKAQTGSRFLFLNKAVVLRNRSELIVSKNTSLIPEPINLTENSSVSFGTFKIAINKLQPKDIKFTSGSQEEIINGQDLVFPLTIRSWQKGDFFYPLGKRKKQKVSDFFINNKISRDHKKKVPLLINNGEIVWVAGYRISDKYKITKKVRNCYKVEIDYD